MFKMGNNCGYRVMYDLYQAGLKAFSHLSASYLDPIQLQSNQTSKSKPDMIYFISSVNATETRLDPDSI